MRNQEHPEWPRCVSATLQDGCTWKNARKVEPDSHAPNESELFQSGAMTELPLAQRKVLRDTEPELKCYLDHLKTATGHSWTFDVSPGWGDILKALKASDNADQETNFIYGILKGVGNAVDLAVNACKDSMVKDAFLEKCSAHKLVYRMRLCTESQVHYGSHGFSFEGGVWYYECSERAIFYNMSDVCSIPIEKAL
jgi:hypothetical protein